MDSGSLKCFTSAQRIMSVLIKGVVREIRSKKKNHGGTQRYM